MAPNWHFTDEREEELVSRLQSAAVDADNGAGTVVPPRILGPAAPPSFKSAFKPATKPADESEPSSEDEDLIGPPVPSSVKKSSTVADDDDDYIGPPIPPDLLEEMKGNTDKKNNKDEDDSEEEDDVSYRCVNSFIFQEFLYVLLVISIFVRVFLLYTSINT